MPTRLVLVGAGHPHLRVLETLIREPLEDFEATIVTTDPRQFHPGMLAAAVDASIPFDAITVDVAALARRAGAKLRIGIATGLDRTRREVRLGDGTGLRYDVLSIATGTGLAGADLPEVRTWALMTRPTAEAAALGPALDGLLRRKGSEPIQLVVVGGGPDAVELAIAIKARLVRAGATVAMTLCTPGPVPLAEASAAFRQVAQSALGAAGVTVRTGVMPAGAAAGELLVAGGERLPADGIIWATGPAPLPFARATGLASDADGTLRVDAWLRSIDDPLVFAAGSAAMHDGRIVDPYRSGRVLAHNLLCVCTATGPLRRYAPLPLPRTLITGRGVAEVGVGGWAFQAGWVRAVRDILDRRYLTRFSSN